jgi:hypothetical protein
VNPDPVFSDGSAAGPRGPDDSEQVQLRSTCHLALDNCERDAICTRFLEQVRPLFEKSSNFVCSKKIQTIVQKMSDAFDRDKDK